MTSDALISVEGVSKKFCSDLSRSLSYALSDSLRQFVASKRSASQLRPSEFWALRDISLTMHRGESIAILGVNGAGKSTLLKLLIGSLRPTEGRVVTQGRIAALTETGLGFDPVLTGRENAYLSAAVLGIERRRIADNFEAILDFSGLHDFIDSPLQIYSTGMRARLGFSVAMYLNPEVLLVDEVLAVGDVGFQRKCVQHAKDYLAEGGALILVTHNPQMAQTMCRRSLVIDHGSVLFDGDSAEAVPRYIQLVRRSQGSPGNDTETVEMDDTPTPSPPAADEAAMTEGPASGEPLDLTAPLGEEAVRQAEAAADVGGQSAGNETFVIRDLGIEPVESDTLTTGEPARVFIHYTAREPQLVRWGFTVWTPDRDRAVFTCAEGTEAPVELPAGDGELVCRLPRLPLSTGRFAIGFGVLDYDTRWPLATHGFPEGDDSDPHYFEVLPQASVPEDAPQDTGALIVVDGVSWQGPRPWRSEPPETRRP